jgi:hypothetical protein
MVPLHRSVPLWAPEKFLITENDTNVLAASHNVAATKQHVKIGRIMTNIATINTYMTVYNEVSVKERNQYLSLYLISSQYRTKPSFKMA